MQRLPGRATRQPEYQQVLIGPEMFIRLTILAIDEERGAHTFTLQFLQQRGRYFRWATENGMQQQQAVNTDFDTVRNQ